MGRVLSVRPVRAEEHDALSALTGDVYLTEGFGDPSYQPALRDVASRAASATVLVAELDGRAVGTVCVATRGGPWAERAATGEAEIRMLVVDPAARGTGAGTALVRACLEQAEADGCHLVRLSTETGMTAAHRIYERLGFRRTPERDWEPVPGKQLLTYALPLVRWCDQCGEELTPDGHEACQRSRALDPPRWCAHCRRRMVVQVVPTGWSARCVEHGTRTA